MSTYGSFDIKGIKELEKAITKKYSGTKVRNIQRQAINSGGDVVGEELKSSFNAVNDKGYSKGHTANEVTRSNARTSNDIVSAKVGWSGPQSRWRLVHLEEWGYVRNGKQYKPPSYGTIEKTLKKLEIPYLEAVRKGLMEFV